MLNCKFTCKITLSLVPCQYHALVLVEVGQCSQGRTHQGFQICSRSTLPWQLASVQPSILDLQSINIAITDGFYKTIYFWSAANQHCHDSWLLCNIYFVSAQTNNIDLSYGDAWTGAWMKEDKWSSDPGRAKSSPKVLAPSRLSPSTTNTPEDNLSHGALRTI